MICHFKSCKKSSCVDETLCLCLSPKLERACIPLPEADGAISSGGGQVTFGPTTERRKLRTQPITGYSRVLLTIKPHNRMKYEAINP